MLAILLLSIQNIASTVPPYKSRKNPNQKHKLHNHHRCKLILEKLFRNFHGEDSEKKSIIIIPLHQSGEIQKEDLHCKNNQISSLYPGTLSEIVIFQISYKAL